MRYVKSLIICLLFFVVVMPFNIVAEQKITSDEIDNAIHALEDGDSKVVSSESNKKETTRVVISNIKKDTIPTTFVDSPQNSTQMIFVVIISLIVAIPIALICVWFFKLFKVYSDILEIDGDNTESVITIK